MAGNVGAIKAAYLPQNDGGLLVIVPRPIYIP